MGTGISRSLAFTVGLIPARNIRGDSGIEGSINAFNQVQKPGRGRHGAHHDTIVAQIPPPIPQKSGHPSGWG
jgi:hypothetical protein